MKRAVRDDVAYQALGERGLRINLFAPELLNDSSDTHNLTLRQTWCRLQDALCDVVPRNFVRKQGFGEQWNSQPT
jgi:hypothetical protein